MEVWTVCSNGNNISVRPNLTQKKNHFFCLSRVSTIRTGSDFRPFIMVTGIPSIDIRYERNMVNRSTSLMILLVSHPILLCSVLSYRPIPYSSKVSRTQVTHLINGYNYCYVISSSSMFNGGKNCDNYCKENNEPFFI